MEHIKFDDILAFLIGVFAGMMKMILDAPFMLLDSFFFAMAKAGATAFVCGMLGVAGKYFFSMAKTWVTLKNKNYKHGNKRNNSNPNSSS